MSAPPAISGDASAGELLVRARDLAVGYGGAAILPPIAFDVRRGELWGVIGRNGAGKTTLLRTLLGLQAPVRGAAVCSPGVRTGYVPQRTALDPLVPARAKDLIVEGSDRGFSFLRPLRTREAQGRIARAIEATGTEHLLRRRYRELSEGEKQRVLLARAIAGAPDLLVLDEPTSAMDLVAERMVIETLDALRARFGLGVVLVTHHVGLVASFADRLLFLDSDDGVAVAGTAAEVMSAPVFVRRYGAVIGDRGALAATTPGAPAAASGGGPAGAEAPS
ncbi:MAG: ATP-binding cassette domain-containing protein [Polyangiaceae bacterium]|nr:ATP-binding cassette domain-containing protein [Polyangiaceae bacterium]